MYNLVIGDLKRRNGEFSVVHLVVRGITIKNITKKEEKRISKFTFKSETIDFDKTDIYYLLVKGDDIKPIHKYEMYLCIVDNLNYLEEVVTTTDGEVYTKTKNLSNNSNIYRKLYQNYKTINPQFKNIKILLTDRLELVDNDGVETLIYELNSRLHNKIMEITYKSFISVLPNIANSLVNNKKISVGEILKLLGANAKGLMGDDRVIPSLRNYFLKNKLLQENSFLIYRCGSVRTKLEDRYFSIESGEVDKVGSFDRLLLANIDFSAVNNSTNDVIN